MNLRDPDEEIRVPLTPDARTMLALALDSWSGPGQPTEPFAQAIGYRNVAELWPRSDELAERFTAGEDVFTRRDWTRAIVSLEISFSSDMGAGYEWSIITPYSDEYTIRVIRELQLKLVGVRLLRADLEGSL
jgi:hypothetical protein